MSDTHSPKTSDPVEQDLINEEVEHHEAEEAQNHEVPQQQEEEHVKKTVNTAEAETELMSPETADTMKQSVAIVEHEVSSAQVRSPGAGELDYTETKELKPYNHEEVAEELYNLHSKVDKLLGRSSVGSRGGYYNNTYATYEIRPSYRESVKSSYYPAERESAKSVRFAGDNISQSAVYNLKYAPSAYTNTFTSGAGMRHSSYADYKPVTISYFHDLLIFF